MKFFAIEGTFKDPLPVPPDELKEAIGGHMAFLDIGFKQGFILVSGPNPQIGGGFILMKAESRADVDAYLAKDPLLTSGIQDYCITEFKLHKCQPFAEEWFK